MSCTNNDRCVHDFPTHSLTMTESEIVLYIWPGQWGLHSFEPMCLAAVIFLQLSIPGKFSVVECTNPELSPTGTLPFISHQQHVVATLSAIMKYVTGLHEKSSRITVSLTASPKAQSVAWYEHCVSSVGDLVAHVFYAEHANWNELVYPALAKMYPIPQRYYVPLRIRDVYRKRLEASDLWTLPGKELEKKSFLERSKPGAEQPEEHKDRFLRVFEREKVAEKARAVFDIYSRLLDTKAYFYADSPTSLDILVAAHIWILTQAPFPDALLKELLKNSYPSLVSHADRIISLAFPSPDSFVSTSRRKHSLMSLAPRFNIRRSSKAGTEHSFDSYNLLWFGLAVGGAALYMFRVPFLYDL
ncbi:hypothetical protein IW262DRAFT_630747 [Armillaria fumosa]|nr:hypothetical protein IW262DRAFT_630747 [Armillaria fumosa]